MFKLESIFSTYTIGRVSSLAFKPFMLYWLITYGTEEEATLLALIFTVSISLSNMVAVEAHVEFYKKRFSGLINFRSSVKLVRSYIYYIKRILRISLLVSSVGFIVFWFLSDSIVLSSMFAVMIFLDIFINEYLRYQIFNNNLNKWAILNLLRYGVPTITIIIIVPYVGDYGTISYLISSLVITLMIMKSMTHELRLFDIYKRCHIAIQDLHPALIINDYRERFEYVVAALCSRHVIVIDRYIVYVINESLFAVYTLLANFFNIIPLFIDMFYMVRNRARYTREVMPLKEILGGSDFIYTLFSGSLISTVTCCFVIFLQPSIDDYFIVYTAFLIMCYMIYSVGIPFAELVFWHRDKRERIFIELTFILVACLLGYLVMAIDLNFINFILGLFILHCLRTLSYIFRAHMSVASL